jgi:hypothetical protein
MEDVDLADVDLSKNGNTTFVEILKRLALSCSFWL